MTHYKNVLDHYANINTSFLHGAGIKGSKHLLSEAKLAGNESVFELGCGTGASLVLLKHNFPGLAISGGDLSQTMLNAARKRIRFCGLHKQVTLHKLQKSQAIPLPDNSKDVIWVESVLAIQNNKQLDFLLKEIHRILKPEGKLVLNETLWLPHVTVEQANCLNEECKKAFGIIQANAHNARLDTWRNIIEAKGYRVDYQKSIESSSDSTSWNNSSRSKLFDAWGKSKRLVNIKYRSDHKTIIQKGEQIISSRVKVLNAYAMVARKY